MALIFLILFLVSLAKAQSGDGGSEGFVLDEVGLALIILGGFIVLVLCFGWLTFCWRILCLQKKHANAMKSQNENYKRQIAQARRQRAMIAEQRNIRRAVENSLNENEGNDYHNGHRSTTPSADDEHNDLTAVNLSRDDNDDSWFFDIEHKTRTSPNKQQALSTQVEEQDVRPPSFNSLQPLQQSALSHTPPVSQQRRMLNTFTHLPQVTPNQEQYNEDIDGDWLEQTQPQQREREPGYNMAMRPTNRNEDQQRMRTDQHQQMLQHNSSISHQQHPPYRTPQQDETDSSSGESSSEDDVSIDDDVNIDDIINQHMSNMPTIGMINTGNMDDTQQHPTANIREQPGHFQRFDPVSRVPIHPRRRDHNQTALQQHPLSYSQTSNNSVLY